MNTVVVRPRDGLAQPTQAPDEEAESPAGQAWPEERQWPLPQQREVTRCPCEVSKSRSSWSL